jgi:hypothetical protein
MRWCTHSSCSYIREGTSAGLLSPRLPAIRTPRCVTSAWLSLVDAHAADPRCYGNLGTDTVPCKTTISVGGYLVHRETLAVEFKALTFAAIAGSGFHCRCWSILLSGLLVALDLHQHHSTDALLKQVVEALVGPQHQGVSLTEDDLSLWDSSSFLHHLVYVS